MYNVKFKLWLDLRAQKERIKIVIFKVLNA